ncbi:MAG: hypothetical protein PVF83_07365 [Anaerolineales bacterium]|jgi:hypothetical protein
MPKTFYTDRDIQDLFERGVTSLVVNDDIVVTDLGRERAMKLGFELVRERDQPQAAPVRPYITKEVSPSAAPAKPSQPQAAPNQDDLKTRVHQAVVARLGDSVDSKLLETIISRVLDSIGR